MVNAMNYLGGKYVTAEQLPPYDRRGTAVIVEVAPEYMELSKEEPLVLTLKATNGKRWPRQFALNNTNGKVLVEAFGKETDRWIDKAIEVWQEPVKFGNKWVPGKKLAALNGAGATQPALEGSAREISHNAPTQAAAPTPAAEPAANRDAPGDDDLDDEIPF